MRVLFLNPPYRRRIVRRYGCSYNSPGYLFPPLELCSLATVAREWNRANAELVDAIAEGLTPEQAIRRVKPLKADLIVFMTGFDSFHEDMGIMDSIRERAGVPTACFGYLPTLFPEKTMNHSGVDYVIAGEPEQTLSELLVCLEKGNGLRRVKGLVWRKGKKIIRNPPRPRMKNLDCLPIPDRGFLDNGRYSMPFFGKPFTTIQTARGCPFACTYCTHFEGREFAARSPEKVVEELKDIRSRGIRHVRFMDNNFTFPPERAKEICRRIVKERLGIEWACLSRVDLLDRELVGLMEKAGCKTVFVGIESGSDRTLLKYRKGYNVGDVKRKMRLFNGTSLEKIGWFIVGAPWEDRRDFEKTLDLAKSLDLDYAIASVLSVFPGTDFFSQSAGQLDFSLLPFNVSFKGRGFRQRQTGWEKEFYRRFYMRPGFMARSMAKNITKPGLWVGMAKNMLSYIYSSGGGDFF
jgi:radical SAM superfamily enzyme YgiQ (UPF0313 family)